MALTVFLILISIVGVLLNGYILVVVLLTRQVRWRLKIKGNFILGHQCKKVVYKKTQLDLEAEFPLQITTLIADLI